MIPKSSDWAWHPLAPDDLLLAQPLLCDDAQTRLTPLISLHHDGGAGQVRAAPPLCVSCADFTGSFVSVVMDLPENGAKGLTSQHILQLDFEAEAAGETYARVNLRQGPNTRQITLDLTDARCAEFDLYYADMSARTVDSAWVDLIFSLPSNPIEITALTLSRRRRLPF